MQSTRRSFARPDRGARHCRALRVRCRADPRAGHARPSQSSQVVAPIVGSYQGMRRDTLVVIEDGAGAQVWTFTSSAVDRLEISAGMKGGNKGPTARWALIGAGVGAAAGWLTALIAGERQQQSGIQRRPQRLDRGRRGRCIRCRVWLSQAGGALDAGTHAARVGIAADQRTASGSHCRPRSEGRGRAASRPAH